MANNFSRVTNLTREKDLYKFYVDGSDTKFYGFDLKNHCFFGLKGAAIGRNPFTFNYLDRFLYNLDCCIKYERFTDIPCREYIDRIIASNDFDFAKKICICNIFSEYSSDKDFYEKNWKEILKYFKETAIEEISNKNIKALFEAKALKTACEKYNISYDIIKDYAVGWCSYNEINDLLHTKILRENVKRIIKTASQLDKVYDIMFEAVGVPDTNTLYNRYHISITNIDNAKKELYREIRDLGMYYRDCRSFLKELEITDYKFSENLRADRDKLKELAEIRINQKRESIFAERQTKELFFENEKYKIYIPTTYKELIDIGKFFHNCAAGYEWNSYLYNTTAEARNLVVVVEKKTNEWKVCTDINCITKRIKQYLRECNKDCKHQGLLDFREEYQKYLNTLREKEAD